MKQISSALPITKCSVDEVKDVIGKNTPNGPDATVSSKTASSAQVLPDGIHKLNTNIHLVNLVMEPGWKGVINHWMIVAVLSVAKGKCLDVQVLSSLICLSKTGDQYWSSSRANFKGLAPSMETEGVKWIFERTEEKHKLHYTEYYGDGDSKCFIWLENTYIEKGLKVVKKECVGHFQKCGDSFKETHKREKHRHGLRDSMTDRRHNYYGIATSCNVGNLSKIKRAIYASLMHFAPSKERNLHLHWRYYPEGADS